MTHEAVTKAHRAGIQAAIHAFYHAEADSGEDEMENVIQAYLSASGMVLVPKEPREALIRQVWREEPNSRRKDITQLYAAIVDAAPDPFKSKPGE